jgi:hypothetical protein
VSEVLAASMMMMTMMMETATTSVTPVNVYQTTRRNNPEDSHLHTRHRENLKSHPDILAYLKNTNAGTKQKKQRQ